ncbi:pseudaminic acid cytidylyltransferase [Methylosinus sp. C49]|uniref:pseudaminic acid cytidylyltransferase n=1 Tax=Methylosinus sp. C49 TaxID=2699395 RepID=UPI001367502C|nr:pseudaminic acid cytidylyltransferase [Methylosinus sp. C49]BBU63681.1 pseudaminic acid cytidylyltransferase [Methylosinus sp. C49]
MRIAVIPARGGSKRIPRKNVKAFHGHPMIAYAIMAARRSGVFDKIIVSTDDAEIAATARDFGAETPFARPAQLADDHSPTVPVIAHAIGACKEMGWDVGDVCCVYPSAPFVVAEDIRSGCALLEDGSSAYVFPVASFPSPIQRALRRSENGMVTPFFPEHSGARTQDLELAYFDAGQFYWGRASAWEAGLDIHKNGRALILPEWRVVDIDTPADWERAELLYSVLVERRLL